MKAKRKGKIHVFHFHEDKCGVFKESSLQSTTEDIYRSYLLILFSVKFYPFSLGQFGKIEYNLEYWKLSSLYNIYDKNKSPTIVSIKLMVGGWSPLRGTAVWPCDCWDWDWVVSRTDGVTEGRREPQPRHSERTVITGKYWSWRCCVGAGGAGRVTNYLANTKFSQ